MPPKARVSRSSGRIALSSEKVTEGEVRLKSIHPSVVTVSEKRMSRPPMVGVPCLAAWVVGASSLIFCLALSRRSWLIVHLPGRAARRNATTKPRRRLAMSACALFTCQRRHDLLHLQRPRPLHQDGVARLHQFTHSYHRTLGIGKMDNLTNWWGPLG